MVGRHTRLPSQLRPVYEERGPSSINVLTVAASPLNWLGVEALLLLLGGRIPTGLLAYNQGAL